METSDVTDNSPVKQINRLKKELEMRNKLNEEQGGELATQRHILSERHRQMTVMDQRIADLQSRVRQRRLNNTQRDAKPSHPNVAAVEPYVQETSAISKQDPKYQTLPHSIKLKSDGDKNGVDDIDGVAVSSTVTSTSLMMSRFAPRPYGSSYGSITSSVKSVTSPTVVPSTPSPVYPAPSTSTPVSSHAPVSKSSTSTMHDMFMSGRHPVPSQPSTTTASVAPVINTSGASDGDSTGALSPRLRPAQPPSYQAATNRRAQLELHSPASTSSNSSSQPTSPPPYSPSPNTSPQRTQTTQQNKSQDAPQQSKQNKAPSQHQYQETVTSFGEEPSRPDTSSPSVSSALSVLMAPNTATSSAATKSYRYAPKSVIANTYMRKLGPNAIDQYRKNMSAIYKEDAAGKSAVATVRPMERTPNGQGADQSNNGPSSPTHLHNGPVPHSTPSYNIDPERARLAALANRPNAPRPLRRRLSSGEIPQPPEHIKHPVQTRTTQEVPPSEPNNNITEKSYPPDLIQVDNRQAHYGHNYTTQQDKQNPIDLLPREGEPPVVQKAPMAKKGNLKTQTYIKKPNRVSFDPLALLLDASLEGEVELVQTSASQVDNPSQPNDEGITALHNAICAGHLEIVTFLVEFGCNVNAPDSDGWTPLHCAASCNNLAMVRLLVEHGAAILAATISDQETAAEKCEEDEDGYDSCSEYLYSIQEKLGIANKGTVYAVFEYEAERPDELNFNEGDKMLVIRKGDEGEKDWWWAQRDGKEGYIPRNLLGLCPRVKPKRVKNFRK